MSKEKKQYQEAYTISLLSSTRVYIYIYGEKERESIIYIYRLHLTKKLEKRKYCFHDILIRKKLGFSSWTSENKEPNGKI